MKVLQSNLYPFIDSDGESILIRIQDSGFRMPKKAPCFSLEVNMAAIATTPWKSSHFEPL